MDLKSALEHLREAAKRILKEKTTTCEGSCHCALCELQHAVSATTASNGIPTDATAVDSNALVSNTSL